MGIVDGIDMQHTGEVRRVDTEAIHQRLDDSDIVLISPIGGDPPTGEIFNLTVEEVATQVAVRLQANKLIFLMDADGVRNGRRQLLTDLSTKDAEVLLAEKGEPASRRTCACTFRPPCARATTASSVRISSAGTPTARFRWSCSRAMASARWCRRRRSRIFAMRRSTTSGASSRSSSRSRSRGILVRRSRERLEAEIERFVVAEYDNHIIGCAALYAFPEEQVGELAALAVNPDFRREGYGEALMREIEVRARRLRLKSLFVLTTQNGGTVPGTRISSGRRRGPAAPEAGALQLAAEVAGVCKERSELGSEP